MRYNIEMNASKSLCSLCKKSFSHSQLIAGEWIRPEIVKEIRFIIPDWNITQFVCPADLARMSAQYTQSQLLSQKKECSSLEQDVLNSLHDQVPLSMDTETILDQKWTLGERLADKIASFGGSWKFLICFSLFMVIWVGSNTLIYWLKPADPYPFIFLNLILSCLSAIQAPVMMMSQNRQEAKDRIRAQHDYQVNLKAELEIRNLHEKIDHLLFYQCQKMMTIQEMQQELLAKLRKDENDKAEHRRSRVSEEAL